MRSRSTGSRGARGRVLNCNIAGEHVRPHDAVRVRCGRGASRRQGPAGAGTLRGHRHRQRRTGTGDDRAGWAMTTKSAQVGLRCHARNKTPIFDPNLAQSCHVTPISHEQSRKLAGICGKNNRLDQSFPIEQDERRKCWNAENDVRANAGQETDLAWQPPTERAHPRPETPLGHCGCECCNPDAVATTRSCLRAGLELYGFRAGRASTGAVMR
jgi:hypothetical protein